MSISVVSFMLEYAGITHFVARDDAMVECDDVME